MEPANIISGFQPLNTSLVKRSPAASSDASGSAQVKNEAPPSGVARTGAQSQTVSAAGSSDKTDTDGKNAKPDKDELAAAVKNMNDFLQMVRRTVQFSVDELSGQLVVQVKDAKTNEVIRQIPSEEMLKLTKQLDTIRGLLFHGEV